jgi:LysM repeat protein
LAQFAEYAIILQNEDVMKHWKRLIYYLMINVLVSACTTLAVIAAWDRAHNATAGSLLPAAFSLGAAASPTATTVPLETPVLQPTPTQVFIVYQVVDGDTFQSIADQFQVDVGVLISENGFTKDQPLGPGEVLRIPVAPTPLPEPDIEIVNVLGVGDLSSERIVIRQNGDGELLLAGWRLEDGHGNIYEFPTIQLVKDGYEINIFTKAGTDTADNLFWGLDSPVWKTGDTATLMDEQGRIRASFQVP